MKKQEPEHKTQEAREAWETLAKLIQPTAIDLGEPMVPAPAEHPVPPAKSPAGRTNAPKQ